MCVTLIRKVFTLLRVCIDIYVFHAKHISLYANDDGRNKKHIVNRKMLQIAN